MGKSAQPGERAPDARDLVDVLRGSEARFRAICECAPLGIYVSEIGRGVVYVNPAMQRILGRSQQQLAGTGWQQTVHPDDLPQVLSERRRAYEKATSLSVAARYMRDRHRLVWTQLHAAPMREGASLLGYVGTIEDITEQRELKAQLVVAARLASVGTLAAGVAHEVNTPLAAALGNLEWANARLATLIERCERPSEPPAEAAPGLCQPEVLQRLRELQDPLRDAHDAAQRVRLIMRDLKLFSRPDQREQEPAELKRVLDSAARMAWHELRHRARLVRDYDELPYVHGGEARLGQVFLNLLINAAQAIPEGEADDHEVRLSAHAAGADMVAVEVHDSGAGIASEVLERIFDPFFTTKPQNVGTGLGLAICHRIVSGLGGRIEVESEPTRGSVFRVLLPVAEPVERVKRTPPHAFPPVVGRGRVLVIDDDEALVASMALVLGDQHEVETMTNARAALQRLLAGERFDAVLCDLMMPGMSGMEFHARLSAAHPALADQVIFLTGGAFTGAAQAFLDRVSNARLDKPFAAQELLARVAERILSSS